ncbi:MAG: hypothetical protein ACP5GS_05645 [Nitrososphaeria archaeon]|jgi:hypothetical protein
MSSEKSTLNVLILELATMVVAIALALNADVLSTRIDVSHLISFIMINVMMIWFWWSYVMDRLEFPPRVDSFPLVDVLILILISLIPVVLRSFELPYVAGILAVLMVFWSFMIQEIINQIRTCNNFQIRERAK